MELINLAYKFIVWLWLVLKKGIWVLGFLPQGLDYISVYIPDDYVPPLVVPLLNAGGNWPLTLVFVTIGLLISAFVVHSDAKRRLDAYEYQEPKYEIRVEEMSSKMCTESSLHIDCKFSINSLTPWTGTLTEVGIIERQNQLKGLGEWELTDKPLELPCQIRKPKQAFDITIHAEAIGSLNMKQKSSWENVKITLFLLLEYYTQPIGHVSKQLSLTIPINLGKQFDSIAKSRSSADISRHN